MSKNLRWEIAFQSVKGRDYKLLIYDDDWSGGKVSIQAGETPFVTEEDNNTDFFSPVRGSTGTISILDQDGTKLSSMIPDNNTARPVRLLGKRAGGGNDIMWQGFLTCNTYSQGYTDRPQICELQVASLLEAADCISAKQSDFSGLMTVRQIIHMCVAAIKDEFGRPASEELISTFYFPKADWRILYFWINTSIFFEEKEISNENRTTYITVGKSIKEILTMICTFMGWCVRECPNKVLSFQRMNDQNSSDYLYISYADFADGNKALGTYLHPGTKEAVHIDNVVGRGVDHTIETAAGAKDVAITAKITKNILNLELPDFPLDNLIYGERQLSDGTLRSYITKDITFDNRLGFTYLHMQRIGNISTYLGLGNIDYSYNDCVLNPSCDYSTQYPAFVANQETPFAFDKYVGPFFGRISYLGASYENGLYIVAGNKANSDATRGVFSIRSNKVLTYTKGHIKGKIKSKTWCEGYRDLDTYMEVAILIGDYYWNGGITNPWSLIGSTSELDRFVRIPFVNGEAQIDISVYSQVITGEVTVLIRGCVEGSITNAPVTYFYYDLFITELSFSFELSDSDNKYDRGQNNYYKQLDTKFSNSISVSTELASDMNNMMSPNLVMYSQINPMQYMTYSYPSGDTTNRPERDLLARLAKYYKKKRRTYNIEVEPINDQLPVTRVSVWGLPTEPIAEARDYRLDKSTITLMEESANSET